MKEQLMTPFEQWPARLPNIAKEVEKIKQITDEFRSAPTQEEALKLVKKHFKGSDKLSEQVGIIQVRYSCDTNDAKLTKAIAALDEGMPKLQAAETDFQKAVLESPFRPFLEKKLGTHLFTMYEYSLRSFDERIIEESIEENKLSTEYSTLISKCSIPFRDGHYNLSQMGKFMQDNDRQTRIEASKAYYSYMETRVDEIEAIYDKLVKIRDKMAKKLGYANYVELGYLRMGRYDYNQEDTAFYRDQIATFVTPIATKIGKAQMKRLGISDPHIYDLALSFKEGNPTPKGTTQEKVERAKEMYDALSPEASHYFRMMADYHLLDLETRPAKQAGGYMTYFPIHQVPFIFSNFNGTSGDVDVLTHEFGHSFQGFMGKDIKVPDYRCPTMEGAEIDSMSMEFFTHPYMHLFFDNPERYRYTHLADSISFLPYGTTVDEFQHWVYLHPEATPAERDAAWCELEEKYTPFKRSCYKDCNYLVKGHRWLTQGHIFNSPFYYIDYTLAQVMAFQFFNMDRKDHELAWKRYVNLCKMGGKYPFRTLITKAHLKDPFAPGVIQKTIRPLMQVLNSYDID
ncbi:MAG: M3 family oligoendopeptidase [Bacilli bacterium]|nr:M3 family oligoendopeptidase [Bacilli bacterium]